jgi:hypothetical protein
MLRFTVRILLRHVDIASVIDKEMDEPTVGAVYMSNTGQIDKTCNALLSNISPDL